MKIFIFIIVLLASLPGFSQAFPIPPEKEIEPVELVVTYRKVMQMDSLNPDDLRHDKMVLEIGTGTSSFYSFYRQVLYNQSKILSTRDFFAWMSTQPNPNLGASYRIHKNYPPGKITTIDAILNDLFIYRERMDLFSWEIHSDTDTILGYPAQRATTSFRGRKWVAWFTPHIPISDGPYKFNGLPGLILKMFDSRNHHSFEAISIEKPANPRMIVFIDRAYFKTTVENFFRSRNLSIDDFSARMSTILIEDHTMGMAAERFRRRNNPIELRLE